MTIAHEASSHAPGSAGTSQGSTSVSEAFVGTPAAGKLALFRATVKPETATFGTPTDSTERPWTLVGQATGGTGSSGVDTGPTRVGVWAKELVGDESGSATLTSTGGNSMAAAMTLLTKTAASWDYGVVVSGDDAGHDTTYSAVCGAWSAALAAGDWLDVTHANDTDTSLGTLTPAFTQSGATFGTVTHRVASRSGTNNDCGCYSFDASVSTGNANAPTVSFTASGSTNECGPYLAVRVRELTSGTVLLGQATETETGQPVTPSSPSSPAVGQASETEAALPVAALVAATGWTSKVEVAFATAPMSASPTWTDVTAYAQWPVEVTVGRGDELADVQPATLSLALRNDDGRFTLGNTASPYYPNVLVGKRIRVTQTRNGVTYRRFDGHVNNWPIGWQAPGGTAGLAAITATDRGKRLGRPGELRSMLEEEVLRDTPRGYWPLAEPSGATSAASVTTTPQAPATVRQQGGGGELEFGGGTGPGTDGLSALSFTPAGPTNGLFLQADLIAPVGGPGVTGLTVEAWIRTGEADTPVLSRVVAALVDGTGNALSLSVNEFGEAEAAGATSRGAETFAIAWATDVNDGRTHHLALTETISGAVVTARLYVDGAQRASTTVAGTALVAGRYVNIGGWKSHPSGYGLFLGTISHVAAYQTGLSAQRIADHYAAGVTGFAGERTDVRMGRISDYVGIPAADRAYDTGDGTVGPQSTSGKQAIEAKGEVAATEAGVLYFDPATGKETFHRRSRRYNRSVDLTIPNSQVDAGAAFPGDDFGLVNDMTVTRPGGAGGRAIDQPSIDAHGLYRDAAEVVADTDATAQAVADWRVGNYSDPRTRIPNVTVEVAKLEALSPSLIPGALTATIGTKLRLTGLPASAPASQVDLFVEGWTEQISPFSWAIAWNTSPGDFQAVWQLGVAGFSELGDTTRLAL